MCGIAGIYRLDGRPVAEAEVRPMIDEMVHRGPDDQGTFTHGAVGLGHRRLSILDLSAAGHQPMASPDGRYVLTYNGEVYNYLELRRELSRRHAFVTDTDTEVLLAAYQTWGTACLDRLNGMFAFAVYDRAEGTLFAARDRFGIKPFYYYADERQVVFASEIPPILRAVGRPFAAEDGAILDYLAFNRTDHTERTFFRGIRKLQHGHHLTVTPDGLRVARWYHLADRVADADGFASAEDYRATFGSSVALRLRSDVPVGVCLSGGLDSSSIVSTLAFDQGRPDVHTFSAVFDGFRDDEAGFIRLYEPHLENMHRTRPSADSFYGEVERFVRHQSEPTPSSSPYAQYEVMRLAAGHVGVTLDGQGADEQLAGYPYFFGFLLKEQLRTGRLDRLAVQAAAYLRHHRSLYGLQTFAYLSLPRALRRRPRVARAGYIDPDFFRAYGGDSVIADGLYGATSLREALLFHFEYKLEHLLKWSDRNSMAFSIESRVPFLDYRLVERTLATAGRRILHRGWTKRILRDAMAGRVPDPIRLRRDKVGFRTPEDDWFRQPRFQALVRDLIGSVSFRERGYVDPARAADLYARHLRGEVNVSRDIWKWVNLELWFRAFIDAPAASAAPAASPVQTSMVA